jgi:hypothetical protein
MYYLARLRQLLIVEGPIGPMIHPPGNSSSHMSITRIVEQVDSDVEIRSQHQVDDVNHFDGHSDCTSDIEIIPPCPSKRPFDACTHEPPQPSKKPRKRRSALTSLVPIATPI